jgi:hypothetical protein
MIKFSPDQSIFDHHAYGRDAGTRRTLRHHKFFAAGGEMRFKMLALAGMLSHNNNNVSAPEPSSLVAGRFETPD